MAVGIPEINAAWPPPGRELWSLDAVQRVSGRTDREHPFFPGRDNPLVVRQRRDIVAQASKGVRAHIHFNEFSAEPALISLIHDEIMSDTYDVVVELGAGITTILSADWINQNNLRTRLVSIEESVEYATQVTRSLAATGLAHIASVAVARIIETKVAGSSNGWYDTSVVERALRAYGRESSALVVIDGPSSANGASARFGAIPILRERFGIGTRFLLDDAFRNWELTVLQRWRAEFGTKVLGVVPEGRGVAIGTM